MSLLLLFNGWLIADNGPPPAPAPIIIGFAHPVTGVAAVARNPTDVRALGSSSVRPVDKRRTTIQ